ncbi:S-adenosylmethionine hydroxide adenosyltransferase family protein [Natrialba magadii ATCC 43099]|uniref:NAD operon protein n=1 Tax=Natrialba magadii (strain ATCC 43099 / DSM 3394 / CCM 3739 / CIP 104546 / IAM 13178 / JCM 8861 / NBRC 102185 / NCIMB 2190 / MS3) TaxID=547559 RepID=D3SZW9_NATMM|nr:SAM-dependent chlorinase/fluorinase [Natrialba magadii]ADD06379.1 S-adenosylmethionine hydroxide adenosyltransferase family protein [Natrialba magadii ATCC 43099]ELY31478.1 NAD operon protein [Natrialba magadii ATCC 43099]
MITIASDFGSPYPAAMKGVLCQRVGASAETGTGAGTGTGTATGTDAETDTDTGTTPVTSSTSPTPSTTTSTTPNTDTTTRLVDIAHDFPRQDIRASAFWLREILPYYPPAVHLVVVDPGVGTDRDALVVRAGDHILVGPDNGVLLPVARRLAGVDEDASVSGTTVKGVLEYYVIDETELEPPAVAGQGGPQRSNDNTAGPASNTFHGRDVFAPAAGDVHEFGLDRRDELLELPFLERTDSVVDCTLPSATVDDDRAEGEVLVVDDFGNAITNVPGRFLTAGGRDHDNDNDNGHDRNHVLANGERVPAVDTFAAVPVGERLATVGSHGYVELDVNQGRGDEAFDLGVGNAVVLEFPAVDS